MGWQRVSNWTTRNIYIKYTHTHICIYRGLPSQGKRKGTHAPTCMHTHTNTHTQISVNYYLYMATPNLGIQLSSVQFSYSVVSNFLPPRGLQHTRPPCPTPTPRVYSNSCPLSQWCHPTISSSLILFSSYLQSFPASGSFQMSQFFTSGGQSAGVSTSASVLQWIFRTDFLWDWLIGSPCCPRDSQESSTTPQLKSINSLALSFLYSPTFTSRHDYWKNHSLD